jgi:hypothetical protein
MGRKRTRPSSADEPAKYSFLVPAEVDRKILQICKLRKIGSQSVLLRQILEENIERYLKEASGEQPDESAFVRVELSRPVREALEMAARDYNLDLPGVVRLALAEQLPAILERAREHGDWLRKVVSTEKKRRCDKVTE